MAELALLALVALARLVPPVDTNPPELDKCLMTANARISGAGGLPSRVMVSAGGNRKKDED